MDNEPRARLSLSRLAIFGSLGAIVLGSVAAFLVLFYIGIPEGLLCLSAVLALATVFLPLYYGFPRDLRQPMWFVVLIVAVGTTAKPFYLLFDESDRVAFLLRDLTPAQMLPAAALILLGLVALSIGYHFGRHGPRFPGLAWLGAREWRLDRLRFALILFVVLGVFSFVAFVIKLDISISHIEDLSSPRSFRVSGAKYQAAGGYLRWGARLLRLAFYIYLVRWLSTGPRLLSRRGLMVIAFAVAAITFPFFVSTRFPLALMAIRILLLWLCIRGEPRILYVLALSVGTLLVATLIVELRWNEKNKMTFPESLSVRPLLDQTVGSLHFLELTKTAHIQRVGPEKMGFQYGRTLITWFAAPIPRSFWPQKPAIGAGKEIGRQIFDRPGDTGVPPGIVAELYLNFSYPGVFLGLLVIGFGLRSLYEGFLPQCQNEVVILLYCFLVTRLTLDTLTLSVSGSMTRLLQEMIPLLLCYGVCLSPLPVTRPSAER